MKFRASFLANTGIDPFRSCTIAGACMHVFRTPHLKEKTIARVPPNGYRSMRNYSNKSMGWITYCEKITGVRYKHAWSGDEMYLKDAKLWADAYYISLDVINGAVPSLAACTTIAPRVTTSRPSTPCSTRPWVTCIVKRKDGSNV